MHICIEGIDGTGKTTLSNALIEKLKEQGKKVFHTSEPGNVNQKCSMQIRDLILNNEYENEIDDLSREYLFAVNRRIQYKKSQEYLKDDFFIVQDRGWLSGFAYSQAKGFDIEFISELNEKINPDFKQMFDIIIYLNNNGNVKDTLDKAQEAKQEFSGGDTIESKGSSFQQKVRDNYLNLLKSNQDISHIVCIDIYENNIRLTTEQLIQKVLLMIKKRVFLIVGNSGSGKSTLENALSEKHPHLFSRIISYTTRPIDPSGRKEIHGVNYNFISEDKFNELKEKGFFIQLTNYGNYQYGSSFESFLGKRPFKTLVVEPISGNELKKELEKIGFLVDWVLFDVSVAKISSNLKKLNLTEVEINNRLKREDNVSLFKKNNLSSTFLFTDEDLDDNIVLKFLKRLEKK